MSLDLDNRRWVIEWELPTMHVKGVLKEGKTEEDVLNEIEKYKTETVGAKLIEYYYAAYDNKKDDYVKPNITYKTDCGKTFEHNSKAKTTKVTIERKLLNGECSSDHRLFSMCDECKTCPTKKRKTKNEWLNKDGGGIYITEDTYCIAKKVE